LASPRLYVKPDDRWEVNDVHHHHVEWTRQLEETLRAFVRSTRLPLPWQPPVLPEYGHGVVNGGDSLP
jgi:hypothetical protein